MLKKRQNEVKRNIFLFDEKKHSRTSPEIQKFEKLKESKLNKNKLIAKTLEAFKPKAKCSPFKNTF